MRLTTKLSLGLLAVILLVVGVDSWIALRTELDEIDQEAQRDATVLAIALRTVVESAEEHEGHSRAMQLIAEVNEADPDLSARIVRRSDRREDEPGRVVAAVPLHEQPDMVLEVTESSQIRDAHVERTLKQAVVVGIVLVAIAGFVSIFLGSWLVGRPLEKLIGAARQIAKGGPHTPIELMGEDELSDLAAEMNLMSEAIEEARSSAASETEEKLRAVDQLRHADRLAVVGRMAAGLAHEIGTPLNVISGRAGLIIEANNGAEPVRNATIIKNQTERISKIVRQLLDFARARPTERQSIDLLALVEEVIDSTRTVAGHADVLLVECDDTILVDGDPMQLSQILANVLVNAIDAGSKEVRVSLSKQEARGISVVRIRAVDDGKGMSNDVLEKVFDPFFTTKEVGQGTGLGLSVSLGMVEEHDGWFEIQSESGHGTQTDIYLPCLK